MAFSVHIARTLPLFPNGVFVQWALEDANEAGVYQVSVQRAGAPEGPWAEIGRVADAYSLIDRFSETDSANQVSLARGIYYRVVVTSPSGAEVSTVSGVEAQLDARQRLLKRKILRDEAVMLRKLNGVEIAVLKRRHWGARCNRCFDPYTKESSRSNCSNCYGTTYVGGYWTPTITLAKRGTTPNAVGMTSEGKAEVATTNVTMLDVPGVQDDDVLVFLRDNRRFIVKRVLPTELRTVTVHQRLEVSELARTDVTYKIKVDPTTTPRLF